MPADVLRLKPDADVDQHASSHHTSPTDDGDTGLASSKATVVYLMKNTKPAWRAIGDHFREVGWESPTDRLRFDPHVLVKHLLAALEDELSTFGPARIDAAVAPQDLFAEIEPLRPSDLDTWTPEVGVRLGQLFHVATSASMQRVIPKMVRAVDARADQSGEVFIEPHQLIVSHGMDHFVIEALTRRVAASSSRQVGEVVPDASRHATKAVNRTVHVDWQGPHDVSRWAWVRANPPDATREEVAAALDREPGRGAKLYANDLIDAAPLWGLPTERARSFPNALAYAPMPMPEFKKTEPKHETYESRIAAVATTRVADDVAIHQAASAKNPSAGAIAPLAEVTADFLDQTFEEVLIQLAALRKKLASWRLVDEITAEINYVDAHRAKLRKAPHDQLEIWTSIATGQRDRLFRISTTVAQLVDAASSLGGKRDANHPLHPILSTLAVAAASSHLATTCDGLIARAESAQAGLSLRSLQANLVDLEVAMHQAHPGGRSGDKEIAGTAYERIRRDGVALESTMVAGGQVDAHELERIQIEAQESALLYRVHGMQVQAGVLQVQAAAASKGLTARIAASFSGRFPGLAGVAGFIVAAMAGVQLELRANYLGEASKPKAGDADGLDPLPPAVAAKKIAVGRAQQRFAQLSEDHDLRHFLAEGAQLVENQHIRTACIQAAIMIGVSIATSVVSGWVAETLGARFLAAQAVEKVAELSKGAQRVISVATTATEIAGNTMGQYAFTDDSLLKSLATNALIILGTNATLGRISHDVEAGRAFRRLLDVEVKAIASAEAKAVAMSAKLAKLARWTVTQSVEVSGHAVMGMAMGAVTQKLEQELTNAVSGGGEAQATSAGQLQEFLIQSASIALGKLTHARLGERMPSLQRLAQQRESAHAQKLYADAVQLQALAKVVGEHGGAKPALELLDRQRQLLLDEIAAVDELMLKHGNAHPELGDLAAGRAELEHQLGDVNDSGILSLRLHLTGLHELGGSVWSGSHENVQRAKEQIKIVDPKAKIVEDAASGTVSAVVGGQPMEIHEIAAPKTSAAPGKGQNQSSPANTDAAKPVAAKASVAEDPAAPLHDPLSQMDQILAHPGDPGALEIITIARKRLHEAERKLRALQEREGAFASLSPADADKLRHEILVEAHALAEAALDSYDEKLGHRQVKRMTEAQAEVAISEAREHGDQLREIYDPSGRAYEVLDAATKRTKYVIQFDAHVESHPKASPAQIAANTAAAEQARVDNKLRGKKIAVEILAQVQDGHLPIKLDRVIQGTGLAAALDANSLTHGKNPASAAGIPRTLGVGVGADTFEKLGDLAIGQKVTEYNNKNWAVQPRDLTDDHQGYASSKNLADATQLTQLQSAVPIAPFEVLDVSVTKDASWKVQDAAVRVLVDAGGGKQVYLYAEHTDLALGFGAPKRLELEKVNNHGDRAAAATTLHTLESDGRVVYGEDPSAQRAGDVLISGGSATASWNARHAHAIGGVVDWTAPAGPYEPRMTAPATEYRALKKRLASGTVRDPAEVAAIRSRIAELIAFGEAMLPTNLEPPNAAFKNDQIKRRVNKIISVTPSEALGLPPGKVMVEFDGGTPSKKLYDQVVIAHSTDPRTPEGRTQGALAVTHQPEPRGTQSAQTIIMRPIVNNGKVVELQSVSPPGAVRVLGAAMWNPQWATAMAPADRLVFTRAMERQAATAPRDSPANPLVYSTMKQIEIANQDVHSTVGADSAMEGKPE